MIETAVRVDPDKVKEVPYRKIGMCSGCRRILACNVYGFASKYPICVCDKCDEYLVG